MARRRRRMQWQVFGVIVLVAAGSWLYLQKRRPDLPPATLGQAPDLRAAAAVGGADRVTISGADWPVTEFRGIGLPDRPLDLRSCFRFDGALPEGPEAGHPAPPAGPGWFDCWDGARIAADLAAGNAVAILAEAGAWGATDRIIAVYPDGRAFQWRQSRPE